MFRASLRMSFAVVLGVAATPLSAAETEVDFERDVRPLFVAKCMKCHGPEKSQGGLRLDRREHAFGPTDSGTPALVAKETEKSELLRRVSSEDEAERMPPEGDPLTVNEIALLRSWIAAGAVWPAEKSLEKHWAYVAPQRPALPPVKDVAWCRSPLDRFVLARLEAEGLKPSPEADPAVLCRRVHFDLTGLPPTPEEVDQFVRDYAAPGGGGEQAYATLVDRLLASPHFGERWARQWLDLARYADSNGFQRDGFRTMWAFRDWVVQAFNQDMPYTQFVTEQVAGDLLPDASLASKIATGFNRCTTVNVEAGTDPEENRVLAVVDRVNTMATVFLGTTLACAQCHNHKYDPFTQVDYYRLLAYFNNTEVEIKPTGSRRDFTGPSMPLPASPEEVARRTALEKKLKALEAELAARGGALREMERELVERMNRPTAPTGDWQVLAPTTFESAGGATPVTLDDNSVLLTEDRPEKDVYTITVQTKLRDISGFRIEALTDESLPGKGPGRGDDKRPNFILSEVTVTAAPVDDPTAKTEIELAGAKADFAQNGYAAAAAIDGELDRGGWAIGQKFFQPHWISFNTRQPVGNERGTILTFRLHQNYGGSRTIGRVRLSAQVGGGEADGASIPDDVAVVLRKEADKRTKAEFKKLEEYCLTLDPVARKTRESMTTTQQLLKKIETPTTLVMVELPEARPTAVMKRGNFLDLGPRVTPGVPASLHPAAADAPANRLGLARWLADDRNPLLARVAVNRWWAELFGRGLVATQEDFGTQADPPTHPELLDWLAVELREGTGDSVRGSGGGEEKTGKSAGASSAAHPSPLVPHPYSIKHLLKTIVLSAAYRQSSAVTPALLKRDPYNLLYARGPRFRLPAETIRDNALAAAGLLSGKLGGPPVYPPQPEGLWRVTGEVDNNYYTSKGEDRFRRGLYTIWRRSAPYPSFVNFDAPERSACVVARPRTNTPLQALTLLNDPVYVETAGALARRMATEANSADAAARIGRGFRLLLARAPKPVEMKLLVDAYRQELSLYQADAEKRSKVLASAKLDAAADAAQKLDPAELAALLHVATLLLNLDETITKG